MNDSSTNIYCVPANVISTGSGLSTVFFKMRVVRNLLFLSSYVYIFLRVSHEIMLFLCLDFSPWYLQMLLLLLLLTVSSLVEPGWKLPDQELHPHCLVFAKWFRFVDSSPFHSSSGHPPNGIPMWAPHSRSGVGKYSPWAAWFCK